MWPFGSTTINITAESIVWYAAIVSTFSAIKVIYDIWQDKQKLQLGYRTDATIQNSPNHDENVKQFCLEVVNLSKRTIKVVNVGYFTKDGIKHLMTDSLYDLPNRILTDNNPSTAYFIPAKHINTRDIWYLYALDGRNKVYKSYEERLGFLRHVPVFFIRRKRNKQGK